MNWQHFRAFLWLRWRLRVNQLKRAGTLNAVILGILAVGLVFLAIGMFAGSILLGAFILNDAAPDVLMYVWDGIVVAFFFSWGIGLLIDLQQSEVLSLDKFLHLPVSLKGAFLINYLSSLFSVTLIIFVPMMLGLALALAFSRGLTMVMLLPLLAAFLFMVTAGTHQFRSWLGSLMVNKRRRRTVIVVVTMTFVLLAQLPNLVNIIQPWGEPGPDRSATLMQQQNLELTELHRSMLAKEISPAEYQKRAAEIQKKYKSLAEEHEQQNKQQGEHLREKSKRTAWLFNLVLPPGWLPLGVMAAAEDESLVPVLCILGLVLIGSASLWRSYRTTVRMYTGQFTSGNRRASTAKEPSAPRRVPAATVKAGPATLLEKKLPWISDQASAIAMASFRSLLRAPEVKMMFLTPVIMVVIFGALLTRKSVILPEQVLPLIAFAAMSMILLSMIQLIGNQFGFDRSGFRVFVLCAAPRKDVLMGKNLAFAPLALGLGGLMVLLLECLKPMRWDHFLAVIPQMVSMYLLFCLLANCLSILAPVAIASGSMKMTNIRGLPLLLHFVFVFLFPVVLAPTLLPLGVECLAEAMGSVPGLPISLVLSLLECGVVVLLYRLLLPLEGQFLQSREQAILQIVATKAES